MKSAKRKVSLFADSTYIPILALLVIFFIINAIITTNFLSTRYIMSIFLYNTPVILISIGLAVVILGGGIDISQGSLVTVLNVTLVTLVVDLDIPVVPAVIIVILLGMIVGAINGVVTAFFNVPPLLATFAMTAILSGIALWVMPFPQSGMPREFINRYNGNIWFIPTPIVILAAVVLLWVLIRRSRIGIWLYAFGNNSSSAYNSGVPVRFVQLFTYVFAGFVGGVAAVSLTASTGAGDALIAQSLSMQAVAACVIGGLSLAGGKGGIGGALMGAIFLCLVTIMVFSLKVHPFYQNIIQAVIMLAGVIGTVVVNRVLSGKLEEGNRII